MMNNEVNSERKFDLEDRLIDFAVLISTLSDRLPNNRVGVYIAGQIIRSGLAPSLNYGEAQAAESRNDFIHKMKIILKELRETMISLKLIERLQLYDSGKTITTKDECNQLISIFVKSIETARRNNIK